MRIIAGRYKKVNLNQTIDKSIRPLKDSAKEGIFNVLTHSTKLMFDFKNSKNLENVTRILFSNRRKMINKNFIKLFKGKVSIANDLNLDLEKRPEEISSEMFYKITVKYEELFG